MGINVLSLFDGMSCGQIALERANIKVDNYYAAEIKKHAIECTQHNYPNTIQLGDVTKIDSSKLPKIDLLIGGSPCQDFSRANKERKGVEGTKSSLFFEYIRLLKELKPTYFLLENVIMSDYNYYFISNELNCEPVRICGSLVSGALRDRLYWTNIPPFSYDLTGRLISNIPQPKDKMITLQSVLDSGIVYKRKHTCLNTSSGVSGKQEYLKHRNNTTGMITLIYEENNIVRTVNQNELERLHNVPDGYTSILNQKKAGDLIGDGWTVDIATHIFSHIPYIGIQGKTD
jgi:DNA (cytosine-5)-methyltransferase 3A